MKTLILCFFSLAFTTGKCTALCPDTWVSYHGSCYLFSTEAKSFTESEQFCIQKNAHLVKVHNERESLFLRAFSTELQDDSRWIGLTDDTIEGVWRWIDGSDATFTDFRQGEPNQYTSANCAMLWTQHDYQWADEPCSKAFKFICEKPTLLSSGKQQSIRSGTGQQSSSLRECTALCPDTWVSNHGSCYLFSNESKSFTESEHFCVQENAHLVKVDSTQESLFLISFSTELKDGPRWIGLTDATISRVWTWTDDSDNSGTSFTDFHLGEANHYTSANCAVLWVQHKYQWAVEPCSKVYKFICKKPESEPVVG